MEQNLIQINGKIMKNVNARIKDIIYAKKLIFGILMHLILTMEGI